MIAKSYLLILSCEAEKGRNRALKLRVTTSSYCLAGRGRFIFAKIMEV